MCEPKNGQNQGEKRRDCGWDDWGGYIGMKIRKLDEQFDEIKDEENNGSLSKLFQGVVIFVNGYTVPSSDELKKLLKRYGGGFQQYYSRAKCSHIVATNLPDSKIKELRDEKVVHPNWITDSVKEGKLLPYKDYLLYGSHGKYGDTNRATGTLKNFVKPDNKHTHNNLSSKEKNYQTENATTSTATASCSETITGVILEPCGTAGKHTSLPKTGDPNFVTEFYNNSRLHYLSTWGAEFKDYINNLIASTDLKPSKKVSSKTLLGKRVIMHIDMDCFFVSVTLKSRPELKGLPVAVCHAGSGPGTSGKSAQTFSSTAEIASCSYEARSFGLHNGMWLGDARKLCPDLICVPYEFQQYREVSQKLYEILASYTHEIQAVSCDEAFVDITSCLQEEGTTPLELAQCIRNEIFTKTKCPASAGMGRNILLARLCTKVAKPNGQFCLEPENVQEFIRNQKVADLPGVGYSSTEKLKSLNVLTCCDLQRISLQVLRKTFGKKTGDMLYKYCRGEDDRQLKIERERKSVSAEINYGIRFEKDNEPEKFIGELSNEVHRRLKSAGVKGRHLTFKLRVRQKDAPINPVKFMGCGRCDSFSKSTTFPFLTDDPDTIAKDCINMLKLFGAPVTDIRGMGIQIGKLSKNNPVSKATKGIRNFIKNTAKTNDKNLKTQSESSSNDDNVPKDNEDGGRGDEDNEDFSLVLSDDDDHRQEGDPKCLAAMPFSHSHQIGKSITSDIKHSGDHPPLPVFSPRKNPSKGTNQNFLKRANQKSPAKTNQNSPTRAIQVSPRGTNQISPGRTNQISPGRTNQKSRSSAQRSLHTAFQAPFSNNTPSNLALPSPSQIDPAVFDALPDEIKHDIKVSYRQRNQKFPLDITECQNAAKPGSSLGLQEERFSQIDQDVFDTLPDEVRKEIETTYKPKLLGKKDRQKVEKKLLKQKKSAGKKRTIKTYATAKEDNTPHLDPTVLQALPESLRQEVQLAYEQQKRHDQKEKNKQHNIVVIPTDNLGDSDDNVVLATLDAPKVSLAGAESLSDIRKMLRLWTSSTEVPVDEDVRILVEFFETLICQKDLEKMWTVLKFFRRLVSDIKSWHFTFNTILRSVHEVLQERYGSRLSLDYFSTETVKINK